MEWSGEAAFGIDDRQRAVEGLKGIVGKRLTYRRTHCEFVA